MIKLVDASGKPIQATKVANLVIFESQDGVDWTPKYRNELPSSIFDKDALGYMASGEILEAEDGKFYRAEKVDMTL